MKILYFTNNETTQQDVYLSMQKIGHQVKQITYPITDYCFDINFSHFLQEELDKNTYDLIFSVYFIPLISKIAFARKQKYAVWVFDAMPFSMYSQMIFSPYNYIFTFDEADCNKMKSWGVTNVWHLPLAVNAKRIKSQIQSSKYKNLSDSITFLGSLYTGEYDFFSQIENLPKEIEGYVDAIIDAQLCFPGSDLLKEMVTDNFVAELEKYASITSSDEFFYTSREVFIDMLFKRAATRERPALLKELSNHYKVTLFTNSDTSSLTNVHCNGYVDYYTEMPIIFNKSAINLNIPYRAIQSGASLRAFDIMSAGGFLLSGYQPELSELFIPDKDFVYYYNKADLLDKVNYYMAHPKERMDIAQNGQKKVNHYYTYEIQLEKMFSTIKNFKSPLL